MPNKMKFLYMVGLHILLYANLQAQTMEEGKEFPVPTNNPNQLFYLQRTENTNTVVYELNEQNGNLNSETPIHVFWIMYNKKEAREELSEMENKFAYGIKVNAIDKNQYQFTLVACPKIILHLIKDAEQKYHVYVTPIKQQMILHRTYIKLKQGGFKLKPDVEYIDFIGADVTNGKEITERYTPQ